MIKKFVILFLNVFCYFLLATSAFAKDFSSFYKTTYTLDESGITYTTQEISLVNHSADYYVSEYTLSILGSKIDKIEAFDHIGPLEIKTSRIDENTLINLRFNEKVVGKEKMLSFIIKYQSSDLAKKEGNLWQISIPKLAEHENIDEYQLLVKVPLSMGKIAFVNPNPRNVIQDNNFSQLRFEKNDLTAFGVLITVGPYQTFDFKMNYELENQSTSPVVEKIPFPPDTDYQTIFYQSVKPKPENVEEDVDGNWIASYRLSPNEKISVSVEGQVNVFSRLKITKENQNPNVEYLQGTKYWPVENSKIRELAQKLKTPKNIYRFVVETLSYDYESVKKGVVRKGALSALENPSKSVCSDFTDLFITLSRAAGIPARELAGFAFTDNPKFTKIAKESDLLHSWPEYFDKENGQWIPVDPTWENTSGGLDFFDKFDMSHFVFVIHGQSDVYPLSPGSYHGEKSEGKQVFVTLGKEDSQAKRMIFSLTKVSPKTILTMKNNRVEMDFVNESGFAVHNENVSAPVSPKSSPSSWQFPKILPFGRIKIYSTVNPPELLKDYLLEIPFSFGEQKILVNLAVVSLSLRLILVIGLLFIIILIILLWRFKKRGTWQKRKNNDIV